jgi:multidrug efflux system outer membrane protein
VSLGEAARLQRVRFEEGAVPESDYQQARIAIPRGAFPGARARAQIAQQENFISVLLGRNPGPIARGRDIDALLFPVVPTACRIAARAPPDIRQAEENLIAATPTSASRRPRTFRISA